MEDVVPNLESPSPDQAAETEEMRRCVRAALRDLSKDARRALTLRHSVGLLRGKQLAKSLGRTGADVERPIDRAPADLRRKLADSACTFCAHEPSPAAR
jgi:DNA-directed RNA polymerase specialized sigma24 family protein